jgi:hypothetical protein
MIVWYVCLGVVAHRDDKWIGEILYFIQHKKAPTSDDAGVIFAVVAWRVEEDEVDGRPLRRFLGAAMQEVRPADGDLPERVVPIQYIEALVHMFHDCSGQTEEGGGCPVDQKYVVHDMENPRWLLLK